MKLDYDVVIVGGAFSGAATALVLKRKRPEARVLIIEKNAEFGFVPDMRLWKQIPAACVVGGNANSST